MGFKMPSRSGSASHVRTTLNEGGDHPRGKIWKATTVPSWGGWGGPDSSKKESGTKNKDLPRGRGVFDCPYECGVSPLPEPTSGVDPLLTALEVHEKRKKGSQYPK